MASRNKTGMAVQLMLWAALLFLSGCGPRAPQLKNGDEAPAFTLPRAKAGQASFPQDYRGKVVVIRFWADWCPYCKKEMADIEAIYRKHRERGLAVLAVNVGQGREVAVRFAQNLNLSYEVLLDEHSDTAKKYGVTGLPTTYFIDRQGKIHAKILGESDARVFERLAGELL